jgi:hypothetical protein
LRLQLVLLAQADPPSPADHQPQDQSDQQDRRDHSHDDPQGLRRHTGKPVTAGARASGPHHTNGAFAHQV